MQERSTPSDRSPLSPGASGLGRPADPATGLPAQVFSGYSFGVFIVCTLASIACVLILLVGIMTAFPPGQAVAVDSGQIVSKQEKTKPEQTKPAGPDGAKLYAASCSTCHGQDGKGVPNLGKDLTLANPFMKGKSDAELLAFIKEGRAADDPANTTKIAMPPKGGAAALTDAELLAIVAHLRGL